MLVSAVAMNRSEKSIGLSLASLLGSTDEIGRIGRHSPPVVATRSQASPFCADLCSVDLEQLEAEDKLGCARGVLWALVFEAALAAGVALFWKFQHFHH